MAKIQDSVRARFRGLDAAQVRRFHAEEEMREARRTLEDKQRELDVWKSAVRNQIEQLFGSLIVQLPFFPASGQRGADIFVLLPKHCNGIRDVRARAKCLLDSGIQFNDDTVIPTDGFLMSPARHHLITMIDQEGQYTRLEAVLRAEDS